MLQRFVVVVVLCDSMSSRDVYVVVVVDVRRFSVNKKFDRKF